MYLNKVILNNIRKFNGYQEFVFDKKNIINTISGKNGSGKSTIVESVILCQKAFFVNQMEPVDVLNLDSIVNGKINLREQVGKELCALAAQKKASIQIDLVFLKEDIKLDDRAIDKEEFYISIILSTADATSDRCNWNIKVLGDGGDKILPKIWNLQNPSNIIVFLNADKIVYEDDFTYQKISMISEENMSPIINFVLDSKKIYQNMYNIIMNAYIYQRINPQNPRKDKFFNDSQIMFEQVMQGLRVSNFSGKDKKDQFVLMAKSKAKYDARNMSSGEKLVWYTFLLLNYIKKIGILIIDEPENHLHEQLAWKFIEFLKKLALSSGETLHIGQIFLITHAKNIIYNNFADGENYVIESNNKMHLIDKENCEDVLRECGISYVDDKILFVEGKTESEYLEKLCGNNNIKIRELANCSEIIQVYKSLLKVKELVYVPKFVFMTDRDTKKDKEISGLRNLDKDFYDKHFAFLPVHEIENFFLDEKKISKSVNNLLEVLKKEKLSEDTLQKKIRRIADESLEDTKRKYLNNEIRLKIKDMANLIKQRDIAIGNQNNYEEYIDQVFSGEKFEEYIKQIKDEHQAMMEKYNLLNWNKKWKKLCDGKRVFNQFLTEIGKEIGVPAKSIEKMIIEDIISDSSSDICIFWKSVLERLE